METNRHLTNSTSKKRPSESSLEEEHNELVAKKRTRLDTNV